MRTTRTLTVLAGLVLACAARSQWPCDSLLHASFNTSANGTVVSFINTSWSAHPNGTTYGWSFGDGQQGAGFNTTHTYAPGTYTACLWAVSENCFDSACTTISVGDGPSPCDGLNAGFQVTTQGHLAAFNSTSASNDGGYEWDFGDGTAGDGQDPMHTYAQPGQYHACLKVWAYDPQTQDTCVADHCEWVTIVGDSINNPCEELNAGFSVQTQGHVVSFHNTTNNNNAAYLWHFGDGASTYGMNPVHTYAQPGQYHACLITWTWNPQTQDTCFADHCEWITILGDSTNTPCEGLNAGFQVTAQGNVATFNSSSNNSWSYLWNFGDGTSGFGPNPVHTYAQAGQYHACLVVYSWDPNTQDTCVADHCEWVTIQGGQSPCDSLLSVHYSYTLNANGHAVFTAQSSLPGTNFMWSYGDGTTGTGPFGEHNYAPGQYQVCLYGWYAFANDSCMAHYCSTIVVQGDTTNTPCDGLNAGFQVTTQGHVAVFNSSSNSTWSYLWNFGDGTSGFGPNPVHTYAQPGQYHACLVVYSWDPNTQDTCVADHCEWVTIQGGQSPCDSTFATYFTVALQGGHAVFTGHASIPASGYYWSFGDGTSGFGAVTDHNYAPGQYNVCLHTWYHPVNSLDSCWAEFCHSLVIQGDTTHVPCEGLSAGFQVTAQGQVAVFNNAVTNSTWGYSWNFGDGTTGFGPNPMHTYAQAGQYHACLVVYSWDPNTQDTCVADHCEWVTIQGGQSPCDSLFNVSYTYTLENGHAMFAGHSSLAGTDYAWDFGDGTTGTGSNPMHTFAGPGQYLVCVYGWSTLLTDSCMAHYCNTIVVQGDTTNTPCEGLNAGFQVTTQGQVAAFDNAVTSNFWSYLWNFGDGTTGFGPNPVHTYAHPGQYHACLVVYSWDPNTQDTCVADHCEWVTIQGGQSPCDSTFATYFTVALQGGHALFTGHASIPASGYYWTFGDGTTGFGAVTDHNYAPGQYNVCVAAWYHPENAPDSCWAEYCHLLVIQGDTTHVPCDGLNAGFQVTVDGDVASFHNAMVSNLVSYEWHFGDGTTGFGPDPEHLYALPGQYHACLIVYSYDPNTQDTCAADHCEWVTILGNGTPCDSSWVPTFWYTIGDASISLWNTTSTGDWSNSSLWYANGVLIGDGGQIIYHPQTTGLNNICLTVNLYNDAQQLVCSGTVCDSIALFVTTGIDETSTSDVHVYPQPFTDRLVVDGKDLNGLTRATLLDMAGRVIDDRQVNIQGATSLDYTGLPVGSYVLRLQNANSEHVLRVMKN